MLFEKFIIDPSTVKSIDQKSGKARTSAISSTLFQLNPFNAIQPTSGVGNVLVKSVSDKGWDNSVNIFLVYASKLASNQSLANAVSFEQAYLLYDLMTTKTLSVSEVKSSKWLYTANAYRGGNYKLKALTLLTSDDAVKWGNPKTAPIDEVLAANNVNKIKSLLSNWQTGDGTASVVSAKVDDNTLKRFLKGKCKTTDVDALCGYVDTLFSKFFSANEATMFSSKLRNHLAENKLYLEDFLDITLRKMDESNAVRAIKHYIDEIKSAQEVLTFQDYVKTIIGERAVNAASVANVCERLLQYMYGKQKGDEIFNSVNELLNNAYRLETLLDMELKVISDKAAATALEKFIKRYINEVESADKETGSSEPLKLKANDFIKVARDSYKRGMSFDNLVSELKKNLGAT